MESYVAVRYGRVRLGRLAASQGVQHKVSALRHSDLGQPRYRIAQRWIGALKPLEFSPRFIHAVTAFFVLHIDFRPRRGQKDARVVAMRLAIVSRIVVPSSAWGAAAASIRPRSKNTHCVLLRGALAWLSSARSMAPRRKAVMSSHGRAWPPVRVCS